VPYAEIADKLGSGHGWFITAQTWIAALACFDDGYTNSAWPVFPTNYPSDGKLIFDLELNYMIGKGTPHGLSAVDDARGYGVSDSISYSYVFDMLNSMVVCKRHM
jgi:hypothetical protein